MFYCNLGLMRMKIINARIFKGDHFEEGSLGVKDGRIVAADTLPDTEEVFDARGNYLVPGFIDLHFHGCMGYDFCDATEEALGAISAYQASRGICAICPATMTYPEELLERIVSCAADFSPTSTQAAFVGINMEGPFISPNKVGAQNPEFVAPCDIDLFKRLQEAARGLIKIVDIAPEEDRAQEFIDELANEVRLSIAHTCADYDCAHHAFSTGVTHMTHCYNAMPGIHHRKPGPIPAASEHNHVTVELIADGIHIHPSIVRMTFKLFGAKRIVLISDSMMAAGLSDGEYSLGGQRVFVEAGVARLESGTIAGSATDLATCVERAVHDMGIPLEAAIQAASTNPARCLNIDSERGYLKDGYIADMVLLNQDIQVEQVFLRGKLL